jgi:rubrerythrin
MVPNRIMRGGAVRRALAAVVTALAASAALAACGSGGGSTTVASDKAADAEVLNVVLGRETVAIDAFSHVLPRLKGADLANARRFRAQEQEHLDAVVKALRGLGEKAEPREETIEADGLGSRKEALEFLYEMESISIDYGLHAISRLTEPWPRSLLGSIVANQAQHLVLLRRALGANAAELVPKAFEDGTIPSPTE